MKRVGKFMLTAVAFAALSVGGVLGYQLWLQKSGAIFRLAGC